MDRNSGELTIRISEGEIKRISTGLQEYFSSEDQKDYPLWAVSEAVRGWILRRADSFGEDIIERLTVPNHDEAREFKNLLHESLESVRIVEPKTADAESSVFTGYRIFSTERLGAMALYIAEKGKDIYKTKLNKLLFYSDFINFYLHGRSISGAKYIHVPFGPVPEQYGTALEQLAQAGRIKLLPAGHQSFLVKPERTGPVELEPEEFVTMDWVLETYGRMSAGEISEQSHREKAYRFTRPGEEIAYRYAALFEKLPLTD